MSLLTGFPHLQTIQDLAKQRKVQVCAVGGFLRDGVLGRSSTDVDFAVSADAPGFARIFSRRIKGAFVLLDKEHGSARVVRREGSAAWTYDFTDFRGQGVRRTMAADLALRDFTVNTLCQDVATGKDLSPSAARRDIKAGVVRMAGPQAFSDDPLRLLRAFSLSAQTGFRLEAKTLAVIKKQVHLINQPAMERVREELFKILQSPRAHATVCVMDKIGMLERLMPQLAVMYGVTQGGYHHLDVWQHSLEVLRQLELLVEESQKDIRLKGYLAQEVGGAHTRTALLKLAALLHDIGKPETRKKEKDRMTFHGHEHVGERITRLVAKRLLLSVKERYFLEDAVRQHLRPGYLSNYEQPSARMVFRYMRDAKSEAVALALLAIADQRGTQGPLTTTEKTAHHERICRMVIEEYFKEAAKPVRHRLLTGHDLIKTLKLTPSPAFAVILSAVEEAQALGKITTRQEALALAKSLKLS